MPRPAAPPFASTNRLALALGVAAALGACHPKSLVTVKDEMVEGGVHVSTREPVKGPVTVADRLDCPEAEGELKRTAQAADGRSCTYVAGDREVALSIVDGADDPTAALAPVRARLDALMPGPAGGGTIRVSSEKDAAGRDVSNVDMPFLHVHDDGKRSHVRILGMTIDADSHDGADKLRLHHGDADADPDAGDDATRDRRPVGGAELVYVLAGGKASPDGWNAVGYIARGGLRGPLVVGEFKARGEAMRDHGHDDHDLDALIDLNAPKAAAKA